MAKKNAANNNFLLNDYLIRYYLHINPDELSLDKWAEALAYLERIRKMEK